MSDQINEPAITETPGDAWETAESEMNLNDTNMNDGETSQVHETAPTDAEMEELAAGSPAGAEDRGEEVTGSYLPEDVAAEVPEPLSWEVDDALDVSSAVSMEGIVETGEAAAITTPKSEADADAEIEAAGGEAVAEGRSP